MVPCGSGGKEGVEATVLPSSGQRRSPWKQEVDGNSSPFSSRQKTPLWGQKEAPVSAGLGSLNAMGTLGGKEAQAKDFHLQSL